MSIDSKKWALRSYDGGLTVTITDRATGESRIAPRSDLPSVAALAAMTERAFDAACRDAFDNN